MYNRNKYKYKYSRSVSQIEGKLPRFKTGIQYCGQADPNYNEILPQLLETRS